MARHDNRHGYQRPQHLMPTVLRLMVYLTRYKLLLILVLIVPSISQVAYAAGFSAIVTSDSMPVYSDLEMNNPIGVLSKGTIVVVYRYAGNVAAIACPTNGAAGIARVSDMVAVASIAKKAVVSVSGAKVYQEASASSASMRAQDLFHAWARPLTAHTPMRTPVKEPGPATVAKQST